MGYGALLFIRTTYNTTTPMTAIIIFEAGYTISSFKPLSIKGSSVISQIRHVVDTNSNVAYIEVYYNADTFNNFTISMPCNVDGHYKSCWEPMDGEGTVASIPGVNVVSQLDLTA